MDCIQRVDKLIQQRNTQYVELQKKQASQRELQDYEKQKKKQLLISYSEAIKNGNKKALLRQKNRDKKQEKPKKKLASEQVIILEDNGQTKNKKLNNDEVKRVQSAIQARAERILQQIHLQKLEECLAQEQKKTKLHQLDKRCRKLVQSQNIHRGRKLACASSEKRNILSEFEKKAMDQIEQLDNIIGGLLNEKAKQLHPRDQKQTHIKIMGAKAQMGAGNKQKIDRNLVAEKSEGKQFEDTLMLPIFWKSTEELLSLDYILL